MQEDPIQREIVQISVLFQFWDMGSAMNLNPVDWVLALIYTVRALGFSTRAQLDLNLVP